ncbi:MAG TPA: heterodisulfide reductase-related iron-sulfur binding cluster [Pyrinomonadaceae bacterium]|jgi:glycolate oxidase iron-sulfur subunit|nr:heterodisulfide reductase-related iron-sulfur binding cluster [Pyrinomonadaceae bacterium]
MAEKILRLSGALGAEEDKLLACVHCGLCLEACPTYVQTGDENDSPRGRIYLMRAVAEERLGADSRAFTRHIDRCLGCRACESACPAGVEYGQLLEAARSDIAQRGTPEGWTSRTLRFLLRHVWLHPARLRFALASARALRDTGLARLALKLRIARLVSERAEFALMLLDSSSPSDAIKRSRASVTSRTESSAHDVSQHALLFEGCVMEGLFARVNRATARVLEANGCRTSAPREQVCCGALHAHAGDLEGARTLARRNVEAFDVQTQDTIVTNAGGCGAMLVSYGHLLRDDPRYAARAAAFSRRVRDISQQLESTGIRRGAPLDEARATYDAACHLLYGQRAAVAPVEMLRAVSGIEFVPLEQSDVCCGGAGVYNLLEPELSKRVLDEKLAHIKATGAQILATGNPGCHMQIGAGARGAGLPLSICHPVELLDESYRRAGVYKTVTGDE